MSTYACEDDEVGKRAKALRERAANVCYARSSPRPSGECWCKLLKEPGAADYPCPPAPQAA